MKVWHRRAGAPLPVSAGLEGHIIYCDEAGFTGDHLLDTDNKYFVYTSAFLQPERAKEIVTRAFRDFHLDGAEMKGARLMRHKRGRRAIDYLIRECLQDVRLVLCNFSF